MSSYSLQIDLLCLYNVSWFKSILEYFLLKEVNIIFGGRKVAESLVQMITNTAIIVITYNKAKFDVWPEIIDVLLQLNAKLLSQLIS